jgi:hypothetical protein
MLKLRYVAAAATIFFVASTAASAFAAESADVTEMRRALRSLHTTERHLSRATQDFDGHRAKALDLVKQAEAEVQAALPPRPPRQQQAPAAPAAPSAAAPAAPAAPAAKP